MEEVYIFKIFNLVIGLIGLAMGIGIVLIPNVIAHIEKKLDKEFSTQKLEKMLNERKNLSEVLLKNPRAFGFLLLLISSLLILSSIF